jgi:hypothetical protein
MCAAKSQYLDDIFINGAFMDDELKVSYLLPDGTPIYTRNPELENEFDDKATWNEQDLETLRFWLEGFTELVEKFRAELDRQEAGQPKYRRLLKQFNPAHDAWMSLRSELFRRVCFCNKGKLNLPEIDYINQPELARQEEINTNQYLERKER